MRAGPAFLYLMHCFACDNEATQRCDRCSNLYCDEHGDSLCAACLDPMSAAPSRSLYRVAVFGLFGGAVLALWLMIRPPSVPGEETVVITQPTATPALTPGAGGDGTGTPAPGGDATPTPEPTVTPGPTAEATPEPTPPPGPQEYVVVSGDTWFGIAEAFGIDGFTLAEYNGRSLEDFLQTGEVLLIPPPQ
jgi:LysM repeat protein